MGLEKQFDMAALQTEVFATVFEKAKEFAKKQDDRVTDHVSRKFLVAYLSERVVQEWFESRGDLQQNIAYRAACWLFETILEHGCDCPFNGHHKAQEFASLFDTKPF